jgi:hypothetical protein
LTFNGLHGVISQKIKLFRFAHVIYHHMPKEQKQWSGNTTCYELILLRQYIISRVCCMILWDRGGNGIGFIPEGAVIFMFSEGAI